MRGICILWILSPLRQTSILTVLRNNVTPYRETSIITVRSNIVKFPDDSSVVCVAELKALFIPWISCKARIQSGWRETTSFLQAQGVLPSVKILWIVFCIAQKSWGSPLLQIRLYGHAQQLFIWCLRLIQLTWLFVCLDKKSKKLLRRFRLSS